VIPPKRPSVAAPQGAPRPWDGPAGAVIPPKHAPRPSPQGAPRPRGGLAEAERSGERSR